jgi:hypothetical protein
MEFKKKTVFYERKWVAFLQKKVKQQLYCKYRHQIQLQTLVTPFVAVPLE